MVSDSEFLVIAIGVVAALVLWPAIIARPRFGLFGLIAFLPFAGVVTLFFFPSDLPKLAKDFLFVLPLYVAIFLIHPSKLKQANISLAVAITILALFLLAILQTVNPNIPNWRVAAIGIKVWLLYVPLLWVTLAVLESRESLVQLLRLMVVLAIFPCILGITQWILSKSALGYIGTMELFYGDAAEVVTQRFAKFDYGGEFVRIPSTFTFVTQYSGFTLSSIVPAYICMRTDPSSRWRWIGLGVFFLAIVASFLSGSRSMMIFAPLLVILILILDRRLVGSAAALIGVPALMFGTLFVGGLDPFVVVSEVAGLADRYSEGLIPDAVLDAVAVNPLGIGTGMNTGPARFALPQDGRWIVESYYAKSIIELGLPGLFVVAGIFLSIIAAGLSLLGNLKRPENRTCAAAIVAFVITLAIHSAKGWQVDIDPVNVYFWVFVGVLFKLSAFEEQQFEHPRAFPVYRGSRMRTQPRPGVIRS